MKNGKAAADNVTALASAGISVAIRKGTPKPDISSPDALKRTLLAAKSISYVDPASGSASGIHFVKVLDRLVEQPTKFEFIINLKADRPDNSTECVSESV